jgi:hypothetical protein
VTSPTPATGGAGKKMSMDRFSGNNTMRVLEFLARNRHESHPISKTPTRFLFLELLVSGLRFKTNIQLYCNSYNSPITGDFGEIGGPET